MFARIFYIFKHPNANAEQEHVTLRRTETTYAYLAVKAKINDIYALFEKMNDPTSSCTNFGLGFTIFRTLKEAQEHLGSQTIAIGYTDYIIETKLLIARAEELLKFPNLDKAYKVASKSMTLAEIRAHATEIHMNSAHYYVECKEGKIMLHQQYQRFNTI